MWEIPICHAHNQWATVTTAAVWGLNYHSHAPVLPLWGSHYASMKKGWAKLLIFHSLLIQPINIECLLM